MQLETMISHYSYIYIYIFKDHIYIYIWASLVSQMVKNLPAMQETEVYLWVRRSPGEGNGKPLQYSSLENHMDRGGWCSTVHGVTKNLIELNDKKKKKKELNDK